MNYAIELHDSECLAFELDSNGDVLLTLDAYIHRSDGVPCNTPGEGGNQRVCFLFESAIVSRRFGGLPAIIRNGALILGESSLDLIPLPFEMHGSCNLMLEFLDDAQSIYISGKSVRVVPDGEFRFVESVDFTCLP